MDWTVTKLEIGTRLSHFIQEKLKNPISIKSIKRALESNRCLINGFIERFGSKSLRYGDKVTFLPLTDSLKFEIENKRILFEDDHLLVYDKPAGLSSEPKGIPSFFPNCFIVHRLDKETSGIMLFAKTATAKKFLLNQFKRRTIYKEYLAIVDNIPKNRSGSLENYLGKVGWFQGQTLWGLVSKEKGQLAKTKWLQVQKGKNASLLRCNPITGRTHQIRVHMKEMGHPIIGDAQYCREFSCPYTPNRQMLHAYKTRLIHPETEKEMVIIAPVPQDFRAALKNVAISCDF